jgi:hypothetical protein
MPRPKRKAAKPCLTLQLEPEDVKKLRSLAKSLGFLIPSGINTGEGSISALMSAIAQQQKLKVAKNMSIDGNPTRIYSVNDSLCFEGENLASKEQYELADRCVGSVFGGLSPRENIQLSSGYFILDDDLDLVQDWQII